MKPEPLRARLERQAKPMRIPQGLRRIDSPEEWAKAVFETRQKANGPTNRTLSDEQLWGER